MTHHVIYVPGLGDQRPRGQQLLPRYWKLFGVQGHYFAVKWADKEPFAPKLARLLALIDELVQDGGAVSLVGTSAGASAVLVAYAARPESISGVVCICGKINHPETIRPERFTENPAFQESLAALQEVLPALTPAQLIRIMSIHPLHDDSVPPADTIIPGAREKTVPLVGHVFSIACILLFSSLGFIRFLKRQVAR